MVFAGRAACVRLRGVADVDRRARRSGRSRAAAAVPRSSGSTTGMPLRTVATSELVVPRSMPTASRARAAPAASPGSEICSSAIGLRLPRSIVVDVGGELAEEAELAHRAPRGVAIAAAVEQRARRALGLRGVARTAASSARARARPRAARASSAASRRSSCRSRNAGASAESVSAGASTPCSDSRYSRARHRVASAPGRPR